MSRIRSIKPTHWSDKDLPNISLGAHLLWIGTWNFSDDKGVFEADPLLLKSQVFPRRNDITVGKIKSWLAELVKSGYILPFTYEGLNLYLTRTFNEHQKIEKPQPSKIPCDVISELRKDKSPNNRRPFPDQSTTGEERRGEDRKGEEGERRESSPPTPPVGEFGEVTAWIKDNAPSLLKLPEPLTEEQYQVLKRTHSPDDIGRILQEMHNWPKLQTKKSAFITFNRFVKQEQK